MKSPGMTYIETTEYTRSVYGEGAEGRISGPDEKGILAECVLVMLAAVIVIGKQDGRRERESVNGSVLSIENDYIKWVDFTVSYEALCSAYDWDVKPTVRSMKSAGWSFWPIPPQRQEEPLTKAR